jgi:hypothetical protein
MFARLVSFFLLAAVIVGPMTGQPASRLTGACQPIIGPATRLHWLAEVAA